MAIYILYLKNIQLIIRQLKLQAMKTILIWSIIQFIFLTGTTMLFINGHQDLAGNFYDIFIAQFIFFAGHVLYFLLKKGKAPWTDTGKK